jgi:hypothetical protein
MKILLLLILATPAFACKMTREGYEKKEELEARRAISEKTKQKDLIAKKEKGYWLIRTTKLTCVEFKVKVLGGSANCKMSSEIVSEKPCS